MASTGELRTVVLDGPILLLSKVQGFKYVSVAALVIYLLEYAQTASSEVKFIWPTKWNSVKVLYMLNRYLVIPPIIMTIYYKNATMATATPDLCRSLYTAISFSTMAAVAASEAVLFLRVLALSQRSRKLGIFLICFWVASFGGAFGCYLWLTLVGSVHYEISPIPEIVGCIRVHTETDLRHLSACFSIVLIEQFVVMIICLYLGFKKYWDSGSPLIWTFYRDGTLYFVILSAMSLGNILFYHFAPPGGEFLLSTFQGVLHSTLTTRMILNIRRQGNIETPVLKLKSDSTADTMISLSIKSQDTALMRPSSMYSRLAPA